MDFKGVIIEESLADKSILKKVKSVATKVEPVTEKHRTPWIKQWSLHTVAIPADKAEEIAEEIRKSLDTSHSAWYADIKNDQKHYFIFPEKIFFIDRTKKQYDEVTKYGIGLGIPAYQVDFRKEVRK